MSKLIFRMHSNPQALWAKVLIGKYNVNLQGDCPKRAQASYLWQCLTKCWRDTDLHIKWAPTMHTKFWTDNWVGDLGPLQNLSFAPLSEDELAKPLSAFITGDCWDWATLNHLLPQDSLDAIASVPLSAIVTAPSCHWNLTSQGHFTTKSAYEQHQFPSWDDPNPLWRKVWRLPMAQRVRTFTWLLLKGKLLTNCERSKRGLTQDPFCSICSDQVEDLTHVFRDCPPASSVWRKILPQDMLTDFLRMAPSVWLRAILSKSSLHPSWKIGFCITFWKLWHIRNLRIFESEHHTIDSILSQISTIVRSTEKCFGLLGNSM